VSFFNLLRLAVRAISRNRFRTLLTMLGVIIGVGSVVTMLAIGEGSKKSIREKISKMGTNMISIRPGGTSQKGVMLNPNTVQSLTLADLAVLRSQGTLLSALSPQVATRGQVVRGPKNWNTSLQGVSPDYLDIRKLSVSEGRAFTEQETGHSEKVCLLGKTVRDKLFETSESAVGSVIRFGRIPFRVIGVLASKGESNFGQDQDDLLLSPYTTVQKRVLAITHVQEIYASARSENESEAAQKQVLTLLRASHGLSDGAEADFTVRSQQELLETFTSTSRMLTILLASIAGISLLVGGIGIMNIMTVSVVERTREIGLRLAVGARPWDILLQFVAEAVMMSVSGGLLGLLGGLIAVSAIHGVTGWPTAITFTSLWMSFIVCVCTGIFFGWYPALKASRLDPIEAIRFE